MGIWLLILAAIATASPLAAQDSPVLAPDPGHIIGTVLDTNGDALSGATVVLQGPALKDPLKVVSDANGFFEFKQVDPGNYRISITAADFAGWSSPDFVLSPGQYMILGESKLHLTKVTTSVDVSYTPVEIATQEVKVEETQRVFGVIPNFYVVYDPSPVPLTTKLKFQLAMKTSTDLFTILGVGVLAAMNQAGGTPDYAGGIRGYAERFGAATADGFSDIMIGGAILPSLRIPATTTKAREAPHRARSTRLPPHSCARGTTGIGSPTFRASVATWARQLCRIFITLHRTGVPGSCLRMSCLKPASAWSVLRFKNFS
jgi:Carboxypeptidase regulatory-like domain